MDVYMGSIASKGIAIGTIRELDKKDNTVRRISITDPEREISRFHKAQQIAMVQLDDLYELAKKEVGDENALIFDVHKMMLEDEDYTESIVNIIQTQKVNAEYAVAQTSDNFATMFANMEDEYMQGRAADIRDISDRLINVLSEREDNTLTFNTPCIIVADDLSPSETVQMDKSKILGFVTRKGSVNSHTAILSRTMAVPALVGVPVPIKVNGQKAIINGFDGSLSISPTPEKITIAKKRLAVENKQKELLAEYKGKETITKSGKKINLYANIGSVGDVGLALQNDAEGIGLFRSEFLYLEQSNYPSEELQFKTYKQVAEMMGGRKVIIRTMDIGADKQIDYFNIEPEENPALGYRAVRICLTEESIFRTQLRALIRASYFGNISIMVPMITSVWEVERTKEIIKEIEANFTKKNIPFGKYEFGIMIETPAAVMIADQLAPLVDFFSIGTNDLTQYTIAIDRQNQMLERFYDPHHPAVLRMIEIIAATGQQYGIWTGICGELAADEELTETFVEYGINELSVSPASIFAIRKIIRDLD